VLQARRQRQRVVLGGILLLAALVAAALVGTRRFDQNLQNVVYDWAITSAPAEVKNQVTIVAIDEATIKQYGQWPLPRQAYADLLKALKPAVPSVIAFDVAFYDPSPDAAQDAALAEAIRSSPTTNDQGSVVGGRVLLAAQGVGRPLETVDGTQRFGAMQLPLPIFREAAAGIGAVNIELSPDARVRETGLVFETPEGRFLSLPLLASVHHLRGDPARLTSAAGGVTLPTRPLPRVLPVDENGLMRIYYSHEPAEIDRAAPCSERGHFCVVPLVDVVAGKIPAEFLRGRVVLVGAHSASAIPDFYATPSSGAGVMYGVEIWANVAQSIFTDRFPVSDQGFALTVAQAIAFTLLGLYLIQRWRLAGFLLALAALMAWSVLQLGSFIFQASAAIGNGAIGVPSLSYLAPSVFWWVIVLGYLLVEEQLAVARTQSTFGRFVAPSVARTIMEREESGDLRLGGEMREMTVLFGDIRGFTTLSEGMDPGELMGTLNRYFEGMVALVTRYQGTVNKYNGDNIMVIWNAPLDVPDHARMAVECALEIQKWIGGERARGGPDVAFGFGVNTGAASAGFLGAQGRMEYTVIGDAVNVASRLTSADIARRDQVAVSAETLAQLGDDVAVVDLGAILVKGRAEAVRCYQVDRLGALANPNPAPPPEVPIGKAAVAGFH